MASTSSATAATTVPEPVEATTTTIVRPLFYRPFPRGHAGTDTEIP
ncbi:MAG: hypothetical protein LBI96_05765 [Odoribacteraceae bacterium]|nr:hypothetical protein [Odoribacteraceae bacterium]